MVFICPERSGHFFQVSCLQVSCLSPLFPLSPSGWSPPRTVFHLGLPGDHWQETSGNTRLTILNHQYWSILCLQRQFLTSVSMMGLPVMHWSSSSPKKTQKICLLERLANKDASHFWSWKRQNHPFSVQCALICLGYCGLISFNSLQDISALFKLC